MSNDSDNRQFNVTGKDDTFLLQALQLVFKQDNHQCVAWKQTKENGLILLWYEEEKTNILPSSLNADGVLPMVVAWLKSDFAKKVETKNAWDKNCDHDGSDAKGWRVYCEDWGHVGGLHSAICGIVPIVLWYGK